MLESVGLTHFQIALLDTITFDLANIPGVTAVVLGGSYARGTARPESDIDVALYYAESSPPEIEAIRCCAEKISIPNHPPTVAGYYKWGPDGFSNRIQQMLTFPSGTPQALKSVTVEFQGLWKETVDLSDHLYTPKFGLPG
jgi:Nucleotidyltransferase domain